MLRFLLRRTLFLALVVLGALAVVFVARTHALGVNGVVLLLALVVVWRLIAAEGLAGTSAAVRRTLRWRT